MNRIEIIQKVYGTDRVFTIQELEHLRQVVELARADEREACAKVCDEIERPNLYGVRECANAIRARGIDLARVGEVGVWGHKREWVGLTRRELDIATLGLEDLGDCYIAIEAKLKEKNCE